MIIFNYKKIAFGLLFTVFVFFAFFPRYISAVNEKTVQISERETSLIFSSLVNEITKERINSFASRQSCPEQEAILVLLEKTIKINSLDYLISEAPKEMTMDLIKSGARIAPIVLDPSLSSIMGMGIEEIRREMIETLSRNNLRVSGGELSISYLDYKKETKNEKLTYALTYNPGNNKIEIKIYSPQKITPPKSIGSFSGYSVHGGGFWDEEKWIKKQKSTLPSFIVEIKGGIKINQYKGYSWQGRPSITIDF